MDIKRIASLILSEQQEPEVAPEETKIVTSVPQEQIDDALAMANFSKEKATSLLSEANLAIENLSGVGKANVLESKDDFHTLVLRLKQMKRRLSVV